MLVSQEIRAEIKASRGQLSLSAAAKKFGVSRRTVGRIYHGAETSPVSPSQCMAKVQSLQEQVDKLSTMLEALSKQGIGAQHQKFRQPLNPELHQDCYKSNPGNYSSPYKDRGIRLTRVHRTEVPIPDRYDVQNAANTPYFKIMHPVSPECEKYPYAGVQQEAKAPVDGSNEPVLYADPPVGMHCKCEHCASWRLELAYEHLLTLAHTSAVAEFMVYHTEKIRR